MTQGDPVNPRQQAQLEQPQQARQQHRKPTMQDELEQIIVYQAAKMRDIEQQLIQVNNSVMQLQAVLANSEQVSAQRADEVAKLSGDLEALFQYAKWNVCPPDLTLDGVVKVAREYAEKPKSSATEVVMDMTPAPAPQTPAEVPA